MSEDKRRVELNGQWFDLSRVVHWWIHESIETDTNHRPIYYLQMIFEGTKDTYSIFIGDEEKTKQFVKFLENLTEAKYCYYHFKFEPPKPKETSSKGSSSSSKPTKETKPKETKPTHYLDELWPIKEQKGEKNEFY